jgi:hypothetical protein
MKALQAIPAGVGGGLKTSKADRDRLTALWEAYNQATADAKPAKKAQLMAALKEIGQSALAPTRELYADRVEKVKSAFTPQQIQELTK